MSKSKLALGRGMGALLSNNTKVPTATALKQTAPIEPPETGLLLVPLEKIEANKDQPRKIFKDKEILELSNSIKENGVIQPISVFKQDKKFIIIAGERRFRASKLAGLEKIPVIVKKVTKKDTLVIGIIENVQRSDLNCIEEALAYYQLMNEFSLTQEEVAKKIGKDRSTIANFLRILKLPREVVQSIQKDEITFGHAKVLASVKDDELTKRLGRLIIEEGLSVRELEKLIKRKKAPVKKETNKFFDEQLDALKKKLEAKTGYHFEMQTKSGGSGAVSIKFSNEAEFNDIFDFLIR